MDPQHFSDPGIRPVIEAMKGWKVALLNNVRPKHIPAGVPDDCFEEFDSSDTVASIRSALLEVVAEVVPIPADRTLPRRLSEGGFDFAFNIAEGRGRRCREAVPGGGAGRP
jgi:hypothetical protein